MRTQLMPVGDRTDWCRMYRFSQRRSGTRVDEYLIVLTANLKDGRTMMADKNVKNWNVHIIEIGREIDATVRNGGISERTAERLVREWCAGRYGD